MNEQYSRQPSFCFSEHALRDMGYAIGDNSRPGVTLTRLQTLSQIPPNIERAMEVGPLILAELEAPDFSKRALQTVVDHRNRFLYRAAIFDFIVREVVDGGLRPDSD